MPKIEMNKTYRTQAGRQVRVICVDRKDPDYPALAPVLALVAQPDGYESVQSYTAEGRYYLAAHTTVNELDLVEVSPYDAYKIDDPVMVRDFACSPWKRRHFAGLDQDGNPMTFSVGRTSFSARNEDGVTWDEMRRPTEEELKGTV